MQYGSISSLNSVVVVLSHKNNQLSHLLQHLLFSLCEFSLPLFSVVMESTPPTSKRVKTRAVRFGGRVEGWFSGDNELIERYKFETSTKVINNPKVVSFDWLPKAR